MCHRTEREIEESKKCRAWTVDWATSISGARAISVQCTYMEELVLESLRGQVKLAHCGQSPRVFSTSATQCHLKSYCTHLEACWIAWKCFHGSESAKSKKS